WASARRSGMTVLGKVVVPKPINLPSQRSENHGLEPNVEIIPKSENHALHSSVEILPKGTLSWGSKSSSALGSLSPSPNTDVGSGSPNYLSGRPSSGSGTRPSTASSDRAYEPTVNVSGPNSRTASASGALTSNQTSLESLSPRSGETRPISSHLSQSESSEHPVTWTAAGTAEKLGVTAPKNDGWKSGSKKVRTSSNAALISLIDCKMKEHHEILMLAVESLSARLRQLESRTREIEQSVNELKDSSEYNDGSTERKLRKLENILIEVQGGIEDLRDKQEISEMLAKRQTAKTFQQSEDQKIENKTCSAQRVSSVQQQSNQSDPTSVTSPKQFSLYSNVPPIQSYQNLPSTPTVGQVPTQLSPIPYISPAESNYSTPMQFPNSPHQQYYMPPIHQSQPPPAAPYQTWQPVPQLSLLSQLQQLPISSSHNSKEMCYLPYQGFNTNIPNPCQQIYPQSGFPSHHGSPRMKSSQLTPFSSVLDGENRFSQPPISKVLPHALPMSSNVDSGSGSVGIGKSIPVEDVIDENVAMGFRRDMVRAAEKQMVENGQSVDLNVVLDELMNDGESQPESGRFGR
ncbi:hypothetical protein UlMin_007947, partial [Ulmus minor]